MLKHPNQLTDNLFESSSMSFGEHLEELRKALIKASLWLAAGTGIGLLAANAVVDFIKKPLEDELNKFYVEQTKHRFQSINNRPAPENLLNWMIANSVMPERVFVDPAQVERALGAAEFPTQPPPTLPPAVTDAGTSSSTSAGTTAGDGAGDGDGASVAGATGPPVSPAVSPTVNAPPTTIPPHTGAGRNEYIASAWGDLSEESVGRFRPLLLIRPTPNRVQAINVLEPFMIWLKAGLLVGAVIASPGIFWHIWQFLAAGLYPHERRYVYLYLPLSVILFVSGVSLAFFVIFRLVIGFLLTYNIGLDIDIAPRLNEYVSFALFLPLGFGVAFQLPIVMLALNRFGILSVEMYLSKWRMAVLVIALVSMILTPADVYSMLGLFIPLTFLYFLGILLCKYLPKGPGLGSQAFDPQG
jgi:sec-independent protein translocase protein TatC